MKTGKTDTFFTNKAGYFTTSLKPSYGDYELIEVQAPEGYVLAKEPRTFTVDGSHKDGLMGNPLQGIILKRHGKFYQKQDKRRSVWK